MFSKIYSSAVLGMNGTIISVEADVNDGLPMFTMVGYLSSSVKEAGERVRTALKNSGYHMPPKRITINLSPADIRKDGSGFDLPIAISVLLSFGIIPAINLEKTVIIGELGLNGEVKGVNGVLSMVHHCKKEGMSLAIVPAENVNEAKLIKGIDIIGVSTLDEAACFIQGIPWEQNEAVYNKNKEVDTVVPEAVPDYSDIKGQDMLKRGMEIAAAGFHNVLMSGAAGAGKSMMAKRLPTIMPRLNFEQSIEVTKIYSISGLLANYKSLIDIPPFRAPHHTISNKALVGGGAVPKPGEVSLAHNGVLFLDELPEFNKNVLEVLRQPLEDKNITISRVNATYEFPADFMLVAAMNLCPCGNFPNLKKCNCTPLQIKKYQGKVSGPLMDRIDINMEVKPVKYVELFFEGHAETSEKIRQRVEGARGIQTQRYKNEGINFNSQLNGNLINKYIKLGFSEQRILEDVFKRYELSARGMYRILKLARTIADLDSSDKITENHLMEAVFYRNNGNEKKEGTQYV